MPKNLLQKIQCLLTFCLLVSASAFGQSAVFDTITNRVYSDIKWKGPFPPKDSTAAVYMAGMQPNGSWPDINYSNPDGTHLSRALHLAQAYVSDSSTHKGDTATFNRITNALQYWATSNPVNSNWWFATINWPQLIGQTLIVIKQGNTALSSSLQDTLYTRMKQSASNDIAYTWEQTDANTLDVCLHFLYRAGLTQNSGLMDTALHPFQGMVPVAKNTTGIQQDHSYMLHSQQLMTASYGWVLLNVFYNVGAYVTGTPYAINASAIQTVNAFYLNSYMKSQRGNYWDYNSVGRSISRSGGLGAGVLFPKALLLDSSISAVYNAAAARQNGTQPLSYMVTPQHTTFWNADYSFHIRPGYSFNTRLVSTRSIQQERLNSENLLGRYLSLGSTNIQVRGGEYSGIFPVWEWDKIPGTTMRQFATDQSANTWWTWGSTSFAGGVNDSTYGAQAYDQNCDNVTAKKSWFYFDDEIVCLGAGITSSKTESLATTLNQSWLNGAVTVSNNNTISTLAANTNSVYSTPNWVLHDSVGYFFPSGGNLGLSNVQQSGSWSKINAGGSATTITGNVFKLWLNHGAQPAAAKYAYIVVPNKGSTAAMQAYNSSNIRIVKNSDTVQAVRHLGLDMMQVSFFKAGTVTDSTISITVDKPCVLIFKKLRTATVGLSVADPTQSLTSLKIAFQLPGISGGAKQLTFSLPTGNFTGSSKAFTLDSAAAAYTPPTAPVYKFTDSLLAAADAYVKSGTGNATVNYGTWTYLGAVNGFYESFLKFNISSITAPVSSAKLRLYNQNALSTTWQLYKVNASGNNWIESGTGGITWNTKPAADTLLATITSPAGTGNVYWDITAQLNSLLPSAGGTISLKVVSSSGNYGAFSSREVSDVTQRPYLMLNKKAPLRDSTVSIADAFVKSSTATTNYGYNSYMVSQVNYQESYLKFNLKNTPANIIDAQLRLNSLGGASTQWQLYKVNNNSWTEGGINWNNKPNGDTLLATINAPASAGYVYWNIAGQLKNIGADSTLSLKVVATANVYTSFSTRESSTVNQRPYIIYTADTSSNASGARLLFVQHKPADAVEFMPPKIAEKTVKGLIISPNPVISTCMVQSAEMMRSIAVYNAAGKRIRTVNNINANQYHINLGDLPKGVYFFSISGDKLKEKRKVLKIE